MEKLSSVHRWVRLTYPTYTHQVFQGLRGFSCCRFHTNDPTTKIPIKAWTTRAKGPNNLQLSLSTSTSGNCGIDVGEVVMSGSEMDVGVLLLIAACEEPSEESMKEISSATDS